MMLSARRALVAVAVGVVLTASALAFVTNVSAAPPRPAPPPARTHPICRARAQLPAPLWRLLVQLVRADCGTGPTTTTTSTPAPTTVTTPTTVHYDYFGLEGTLLLATCYGTPAAPANCGEPAPTAGRVRAGSETVTTGADGRYFAMVIGTVTVQGIVAAPPGRYVDCPAAEAVGSGGGQTRSIHNPVCRSFPVMTTTRPSTTTTLIYDFFGIEGYLLVETCQGTPAAPVDCGPGVRTAGRVRLGRDILTTSSDGFYRVNQIDRVEVQGMIEVPPNLIVDCPVVVTSGSGGGPYNRRHDPVCRTFPAA
jgi:hypothetical protein